MPSKKSMPEPPEASNAFYSDTLQFKLTDSDVETLYTYSSKKFRAVEFRCSEEGDARLYIPRDVWVERGCPYLLAVDIGIGEVNSK